MFTSFYLGAILHPRKSFEGLVNEPLQLRYSLLAVGIMATNYTLVYVFLILGGGQPFKPWLDIPLDVYYQYNVFFCAPSMFLGWILAAAVVHLIARMSAPTGSFEQVLCLLGFAIGTASWSTGIHDLVTSFLGAVGIISQTAYEVSLNSPTIWRTLLWVQMFIYLIWFVVLFTVAVRVVYRFEGLKAIIVGMAGFIIYQGFFLIFNR